MKLASLSLGLIIAATSAALAQPPAAAPAAPPAPPALTADSQAPVVKGKDLTKNAVAFITENGQLKVVRGPDALKAPKDATVIQTEVFPLGGVNYTRITIPKGKAFTAPKGSDSVVYVLKGKINVKLGTVTADLEPGDAWRKLSPQVNTYTAIEETTILETAAPATK